jgi:hypothetical protein
MFQVVFFTTKKIDLDFLKKFFLFNLDKKFVYSTRWTQYLLIKLYINEFDIKIMSHFNKKKQTNSFKLKMKITKDLNKLYKQKCLLSKQAGLILEYILLYLESALEKTDYNNNNNDNEYSVYLVIGCCLFYLFIFLSILYYFLN